MTLCLCSRVWVWCVVNDFDVGVMSVIECSVRVMTLCLCSRVWVWCVVNDFDVGVMSDYRSCVVEWVSDRDYQKSKKH